MAETREMILRTALELCSRRGCEAVSVRDICSAVGIKESSLYCHFPGKQAVIDELYSRFEERCAALTGELDAALEACSPPGREGFMNVCAHFFDGYLSDPFCNGVLRLLDIERRSSPEALRLYTRWMFDEPLRRTGRRGQSGLPGGSLRTRRALFLRNGGAPWLTYCSAGQMRASALPSPHHCSSLATGSPSWTYL